MRELSNIVEYTENRNLTLKIVTRANYCLSVKPLSSSAVGKSRVKELATEKKSANHDNE